MITFSRNPCKFYSITHLNLEKPLTLNPSNQGLRFPMIRFPSPKWTLEGNPNFLASLHGDGSTHYRQHHWEIASIPLLLCLCHILKPFWVTRSGLKAKRIVRSVCAFGMEEGFDWQRGRREVGSANQNICKIKSWRWRWSRTKGMSFNNSSR